MHFKARRQCLFGIADAEQIRLRADKAGQRHDDFFADRIDRRISHLCKQLLKVVVERLVLVRQNRQCNIGAHRACGFFAVLDHWLEQELYVFLRIAESLLRIEQRFLQFVAALRCL